MCQLPPNNDTTSPLSDCATNTVASSSSSSSSSSSTSDEDVSTLLPALPTPAEVLEELPLSRVGRQTVKRGRAEVRRVLGGDGRMVVVVGPCSVHDVVAAGEYATRLAEVAGRLRETLVVVMRVYFEKPRTTVGWTGLVNDPHLNATHDIACGLRTARRLLLTIADKGLPAGCEWLDTSTHHYLADAVSWGAIGARTTESQVHRQLASGLPMPIGFKNGTDGNCQIAVDAITAASHGHTFAGTTAQGRMAVVQTSGNPSCHVILRGAAAGPNYEEHNVRETVGLLKQQGVRTSVVIDVSHGNSQKAHSNQPVVLADVCAQVAGGDSNICGVMIESFLQEGAQKLAPGVTDVGSLRYGVSVTDACVSWDTTVSMLQMLSDAVHERMSKG